MLVDLNARKIFHVNCEKLCVRFQSEFLQRALPTDIIYTLVRQRARKDTLFSTTCISVNQGAYPANLATIYLSL